MSETFIVFKRKFGVLRCCECTDFSIDILEAKDAHKEMMNHAQSHDQGSRFLSVAVEDEF